MKTVYLDFSEIQSVQNLHLLLKPKLNLPDFYGMNWDAFWDSITSLVDMPDKIKIIGFKNIEKWMLSDTQTFLRCLNDYNNESDLKKIEVDIIS
jgi:ribonuclease inhibitor